MWGHALGVLFPQRRDWKPKMPFSQIKFIPFHFGTSSLPVCKNTNGNIPAIPTSQTGLCEPWINVHYIIQLFWNKLLQENPRDCHWDDHSFLQSTLSLSKETAWAQTWFCHYFRSIKKVNTTQIHNSPQNENLKSILIKERLSTFFPLRPAGRKENCFWRIL